MTDTPHYDIAVIGAGAAGLSAAYFLASHASVVVLEREAQPAYHSSGRSAAMYIVGYENAVVQALTLAGHDFFFDPPTGFSDVPLVIPTGGLTIAGTGEQADLNGYLDTWGGSCPDLAPISIEACIERVPILRPDWVSAAAFDPSWHKIDVHALLQGYQRGLRAAGGTVRCGFDVTQLTHTQDRWQIHTHDASVTANTVVNASGAWANQIAALAGLAPMPLTPLRRTAAIVPAPDNCLTWPLVHTVSGSLYFKPESPGLMISPQDETPTDPMDAQPLELDVAVAVDRFQQITDHPVERVMHAWAGLRTFAVDRYPVIGPDPVHPSFFWLAGQGGFGIQTSPAAGRLAADSLLQGRQPEPALSSMRFSA